MINFGKSGGSGSGSDGGGSDGGGSGSESGWKIGASTSLLFSVQCWCFASKPSNLCNIHFCRHLFGISFLCGAARVQCADRTLAVRAQCSKSATATSLLRISVRSAQQIANVAVSIAFSATKHGITVQYTSLFAKKYGTCLL